ncbi:MAG TPA: ABC transporter substrate-binding protein [Casimicrobiaceae bacterium]|jgi:NitT/TauT family transport system substrate-binding protein|nr:ABC transporter substrate-binding protein [Casimicrobiaceae bacterium]
MKSTVAALAAGIALTLGGVTASAQQLTEIKISYQPAVYWALPFYAAQEKGWYAELGLKPVFSTFPAGVPQIAASASKSWDVGALGSVPATLGAARYSLLTIGISNDESDGNGIVAVPKAADAVLKNPASVKGQTIVLTANSTGDYAVQSCLAKWGLKKSDVTIKSMGQAEIMSAMSSGNADLGGLWAPNTYTMEEKTGAKQICSGKDAGAAVPGAIIVRADYAKEHPENVAKFLAVYLRAWKWLNAHQPEAIAMMKKFYDQGGVTISEASMKKEFSTRPTYDLAGQLKIMQRTGGASEVDGWFQKIGAFMQANGTFAQAPAPDKFITDEYMKRVDADPKLKAYANRAD